MKCIYLILLCLSITSCSILSPLDNKPQNLFFLDPDNIQVMTAPKTHQTVLITEPVAAAGFSTSNLLYTNRLYQLSSYTKNRWADSPAKMLAPLMVIALQKTHHYQAVISYPYAGKTDLRVDTQLVRFHQNFLKNPSEIDMAILVRIIDMASSRVKASQLFEMHQQSPNDPYGGIVAANEATAQFLKEFSAFCIEHSPSDHVE